MYSFTFNLYQLDQAKKAFGLIAGNDTNLVDRIEFVDLMRECGLITGMTDSDLRSLFRDLDDDNSGQISPEEFLRAFSGEITPKNFQLLEAILRNEPEISQYKADKTRRLREGEYLN